MKTTTAPKSPFRLLPGLFLALSFFLLLPFASGQQQLQASTSPEPAITNAHELSVRAKKHSFSASDDAAFDISERPGLLTRSTRFFRKLFGANNPDWKEDVEVTVTNELGLEITNFKVTEADDSMLVEIPREKLKPGKYRLDVVRDGKTLTQEFYWGVLAINSDKSIYKPEETAYLQIAALDHRGDTLCDANLELTITAPSGSQTVLNTALEEIKKSGSCDGNNFTMTPDYFTHFALTEQGLYQLRLVNLDNDFAIDDHFEVLVDQPFEVQRVGPTRIWPLAPYTMTFKVKAEQDFVGEIRERVPASFEVKGVSSEQKDKHLNLIWPVNLKAGQEIELSYTFDAPDVSPEFYSLGPLRFVSYSDEAILFQESRSWQIASDAVAGPNWAGTGANYNDGGTTAWTNPTNVVGNTTSTAATFNTGTAGGTSQRLRATNFGFSIPSTATIDGVIVEVEQQAANTNRHRWNSVQILKGGTETGNNNSDNSIITASKIIKSFGTETDDWGASLTPSDVNASNFGVSLKVARYGTATTTSIFRVRITVYYTELTTIAGNIYASGSESSTNGTAVSVAVSVNNGTPTVVTSQTSSYSVDVDMSAGNTVAVYVDGHSTINANAFTIASGSNISNAHLYIDKTAIYNHNSGNTTNSHICTTQATYPTSGDRTYNCPGGNVLTATTAQGSDELHVAGGYAPGANVNVSKLHIVSGGTYSGGSETLTLSGTGNGTARPLYVDSGTFTPSTNTTVFTGGSSSDIQNTTYYDLVLNGTGPFNAIGTTTVNRELLLSAGTFGLGANNLTVGASGVTNSGSIKVASGATISQSSSATTTMLSSASGSNCIGADGSSCAGTPGTIGFHNLTIGNGSTTFATTVGGTSPTINIANALNITNNATLSANGTLNVAGNWANSGTFTSNSSTVNLTGGGGSTQVITGTNTFYNLSATGSSARTITFPSSITTTITNGLTLTGASSELLTLNPGTAATVWTIDPPPSSVSVNYVDVNYSTATECINAPNSTGSNYTLWDFTGGSCSNTDPNANSFQRKTWYDGIRHWRSYYDENNGRIEFEYSTNNGESWTENTSARITAPSSDFSIWGKNTESYIAYKTEEVANVDNLITNGLLGYWKLNESSWNGTTGEVIDSSANAKHGTGGGGATTTSTAKFDRAGAFDGNDDFVDMGNHDEHDLSFPLTISAWIYMTELPSTKGTESEILSKWSDAPNRQYTFSIGVDNILYFFKSHNGTNGEYGVNSGYAFTESDLNVWRHVGYTVSSSGAATLFVDGEIVDTYQFSNTTTYGGGNANFRIGYRSNNLHPFKGNIDDVRIYNRDLAETEIDVLSQPGYDIEVRKASSYPDAGFSWGTESVAFNGSSATNYYKHPFVTQDTSDKLWVSATGNNADTYTFNAIRSASASNNATWDSATALDSSSNVNKYGILVPRTSNNAYAVWIDGTTIEGKNYNGSAWDGSPTSIDTGLDDITKSLSAVSDSTGDIHLIFVDDESTDQISYRKYNGSTWSSATLVSDAANDNHAYPTLSIDISNNNLYAFWIDTSSGNIYYSTCDISTGCDSPSEWAAQTAWQTTEDNTLVVSNYSESDQIFAQWFDGTNIQWDIIIIEPPPIDVSETTNSFQRKTWYDGIRHWRSYYDENNGRIEFEYSTNNGESWTENTSARITAPSSDFSIEADDGNAFIVYTSSNDIKGRKASSYPDEGFSWGSEETVLNGSGSTDDYSYPVIKRDSSDYVWVAARYTGDGVYYMRTIKETSGTNDLPEDSGDDVYSLADQANTNSNVYGNLAPMTSQNMYITYALGTTLAGCKWVNSVPEWQDSAGDSCTGASAGTLYDGLVAYWQMEEAAGATRIDSSSYGNNLTESGTGNTIARTTGKFGYGADFEANDTEYLYVADQPEFNVGKNFTMSAWIKVETFNAYGQIMGYGAGGGWSYNMFTWENSGVGVMLDDDGWAGGGIEAVTFGGFTTSTWALMTVTYDGSTVRLYKDGSELTNEDFPVSTTINTFDSTANFVLGYWSSQGAYYDGVLDDVRLYNRTLSSSEVSDLYEHDPTAGGGNYDTIDTIPANLQDTFSTVADSSGNVHLIYVDNESTDQISYRKYNGTTWSTATLVTDSASDNHSYPTLTLDTNSGNLYAFWIDTSTSYIYYSVCDITSNCDEDSDWAAETEWKTTGTNTYLTSNYSGVEEVFAQWFDGTSIQWGIVITTPPPSNTGEITNSFQRKTWYDGTRYWRSYYEENDGRIEFEYSTDDGDSWTENENARITAPSSDFSIEADGSNAFIVFSTNNDIRGHKASSYPSASFGWGSEETIFDGTDVTDNYSYPVVTRDSSNNVWVAARFSGDGVYYIKTIKESNDPNDLPEDSDDAVFSLADTSNSSDNVYANLASLGDGDMYAVFAMGSSLEGCYYTEGTWLDQPGGNSCVEGGSDLDNGLVGYWNLDEGTGSTANDSSGNGNNGNISNAAWTTGQFNDGLAMTINSSHQQISVNDPAGGELDFSASQSFTLTTWIKFTSLESNLFDIAQKGYDFNPAFPGYKFYISNSGGAYPFVCSINDGTNVDVTNSLYSSGLDDGEWHLVGCVINRSNNSIISFIDGVSMYGASILGSSTIANNNNLLIGELDVDSEIENGGIDDIRIYNRALTNQEMEDLYTYTPGSSGPGTSTSIDTIPANIADSFSLVGDGVGNLYLIFVDDESTNQISARTWNGSSWSSAILVADNANNSHSYPTLSINTSNNDLYAFWIDTSTSNIYYSVCSAATNCDDASEWEAEVTWQTGGTNTYISSSLVNGGNYIFAIWNKDNSVVFDKILLTANFISVTITTDGIVEYGIIGPGASVDTIALNETQTAENDGLLDVDLNIKTSAPAGWTLGSTPGEDTFVHEFSINGGDDWIKFITVNTYQELVTNLTASSTQDFDLRFTAPDPSNSGSEKTLTITIQAVEH